MSGRPSPGQQVLKLWRQCSGLPFGRELFMLAFGSMVPYSGALGARVGATGPEQGRPAPDLVVPIPLHWWRRWRRGFNQAALVGEGVGAVLGAPVVEAGATRQPRGDVTERVVNPFSVYA